MDILDEIDESVKEKRRKWNYTPMREKSETDALIDELLREFSSDRKPEQPSYHAPSYRDEYNRKSEIDERREYENFAGNAGTGPQDEEDLTQVFSRNDIDKYENGYDGEYSDPYGGGNGGSQGNYGGYDSGFDDDYYDEDDFDKDCDSLNPDDLGLDEEEYAEFENFMDAQNEEKKLKKKKENKSILKKVWRIIYTAVIAAFTIIGVFSSVLYCLEKFEASPADLTEKDEALKAELCRVIYPVVETNTSDFESFEDISKEQLVAVSVWEIIINGDVKVFKDAETGEIVIPHTQIEYAVSKLFGSEKNVEPCSIEIAGLEIKYDKDKQGYIVPEDYYIYTSYPVVTSTAEQDGTYTVYADCYDDAPQWTEDKKRAPLKKMVFTLKKTSDYYNILSAKTVS
ncbi:MAG: hypothetical protein ACI4JB_07730 [Porcipelethomonas sp.]